jgi:hypothetical protein
MTELIALVGLGNWVPLQPAYDPETFSLWLDGGLAKFHCDFNHVNLPNFFLYRLCRDILVHYQSNPCNACSDDAVEL